MLAATKSLVLFSNSDKVNYQIMEHNVNKAGCPKKVKKKTKDDRTGY